MLSYCETILLPVTIYLLKASNENTGKQCEMSPKLTKKSLPKTLSADLFRHIHSSSCEENNIKVSDADSDAEL